MAASFRFPRSVCYAALLMTATGDLGTRDRLDATFAREERRGLMVAAAARSAAIVFILGWLRVAYGSVSPNGPPNLAAGLLTFPSVWGSCIRSG